MRDEQLLTISDVAERLQVSKRSVYRFVRSGDIEVVRVGARMRVPEWSLRAYLARGGAACAAEGES